MKRLKNLEHLTGAEAMAAASGTPAPPKRKAKRQRRAKPRTRETRSEDARRELIVGNYRLYRDQWEYLHKLAHERSLLTRQRSDASAALREILDEAMKRRP